MDNPVLYDPGVMGDTIEANEHLSITESSNDQNEHRDELIKKLLDKTSSQSLNRGWNNRNEIFIISIQLNCNTYRKMHEASGNFFNNIHKFMKFVLIISSALLSVLTTYPDECNNFAVVMVRFTFTYIVTLFSVLMNFLSYSHLSERHRLAACEFLKIHHDIKQQMCLYKRDRLIAFRYLSSVLKKYDQLILSSPLIIKHIANKFKKEITENEKYNIHDIVNELPIVQITTGSDVHHIDNHYQTRDVNMTQVIQDEPFVIRGDIRDEDVDRCNGDQIKELRLRFFKENSTYEYLRFLQNEIG